MSRCSEHTDERQFITWRDVVHLILAPNKHRLACGTSCVPSHTCLASLR